MNLERIRTVLAKRLRTPIDLSYLAGRRGPQPEGGWRDLLMLAGVSTIVRGVAFWSTGAAWIVAGAFLLAASVLMAGDDQ